MAGYPHVAFDARIVERDVEPAECLNGGGDHRFDFRRLRYIRFDEVRLAAGALDKPHRLRALAGGDIGDRDRGAFTREGQRGDPPDARAAAGHQRDFAFQLLCHLSHALPKVGH